MDVGGHEGLWTNNLDWRSSYEGFCFFCFFLCRSNQECIPGCIANEFRADRLYFEAEAYRPLIGLLFCLVSIKWCLPRSLSVSLRHTHTHACAQTLAHTHTGYLCVWRAGVISALLGCSEKLVMQWVTCIQEWLTVPMNAPSTHSQEALILPVAKWEVRS